MSFKLCPKALESHAYLGATVSFSVDTLTRSTWLFKKQCVNLAASHLANRNSDELDKMEKFSMQEAGRTKERADCFR